MNELALFSGAGGGILGGKLLGWRTVCAVEIAASARAVLLARQRDGLLERFPIWDDVCTFDGTRWRGRVDVVSGGFPCTDIAAPGKGAGINGTESGLWREQARIVGEVRPRYVFVENSPILTSRGLGTVLGDLAALGYDARWGVLGSRHTGGFHDRERIWLVANAHGEPLPTMLDRGGEERGEAPASSRTMDFVDFDFGGRVGRKRIPQPGIPRVVDAVAGRVDRLTAIGNGQDATVAALAWRCMTTL